MNFRQKKGMVIRIMVNRVDGNRYYEYTKTQNLSVSDTDEKFSLDYKQNELSDQKSQKDKEVSEREKQKAAEQSGVRVDISGYGRRSTEAERKQASPVKGRETVKQGPSLFAVIQDIFKTAIATFRDFFDKIWNEPQTENAAQETLEIGQENEQQNFSELMNESIQSVQDTEAEQPETMESFYQNEARLNQEIQPYLRKGDLNQVINLLTDNGKKTAARNSTLLTYYDRNGRMVEPSASDSQRILYGDRNARKL